MSHTLLVFPDDTPKSIIDPINAAKHILPQLMQHGRVVRGYLGLHGHNVPLAPTLNRLHGLNQAAAVEVVARATGGWAQIAD